MFQGDVFVEEICNDSSIAGITRLFAAKKTAIFEVKW